MKEVSLSNASLTRTDAWVLQFHNNGSASYIEIGAALYFDDCLDVMSAIFHSSSVSVCCFGVFWSC